VILSAARLRPELSSESVPVPERPEKPPVGPATGLSMRDFVREQRRAFIRQALQEHGGNVAAAARALGMDRGNLYRLARRLGLIRAGAAGK